VTSTVRGVDDPSRSRATHQNKTAVRVCGLTGGVPNRATHSHHGSFPTAGETGTLKGDAALTVSGEGRVAPRFNVGILVSPQLIGTHASCALKAYNLGNSEDPLARLGA
jgi:hypothetical protein